MTVHVPIQALYALAMQLERRRKHVLNSMGSDALSQPSMDAKLMHMRNKLLEAATNAEREADAK